MDLSQLKLTKAEWESIETPVDENEKKILDLIIKGSNNINYSVNHNLSINSFMKLPQDSKIEAHTYNVYFSKKIEELTKLNGIKIDNTSASKITLKKADQIRFNNLDAQTIKKHSEEIFEFVLLGHLEKLFKYTSGEKYANKFMFHYYTLYHLLTYKICNVNQFVVKAIQTILNHYSDKYTLKDYLSNAVQLIENNKDILKYKDKELYSHQKKIFSIFNSTPAERLESYNNNLVLYTAPTGTGKTLTPLGLASKYKIIFVCAARHVGLALAKAAISVGKKIAFAFGCSDAGDIRLHYYAASDFTKNYKTGGIFKVDNSVGDKVEIIICDLKSYLPAMHYMLAFNLNRDIITYWDEPTISLDYQSHELHDIISNNWKENLIENVVFSSATLPAENEIFPVLSSFKAKCDSIDVPCSIHNVSSYDSVKSISLIDPDGYAILPHLMYEDYEKVKDSIQTIKSNKSILRYMDLNECIQFILFVEKNKFIRRSSFIYCNFETIADLTMSKLKDHYLDCLDNIVSGTWGSTFIHFKMIKTRKIEYNQISNNPNSENIIKKNNSIGPGCQSSASSQTIVRQASLPTEIKNQCSVYITTSDAYSFTDGPTIFITNAMDKISAFCISQAAIPQSVLQNLYEKIGFNEKILTKIQEVETLVEAEVQKLQTQNDSGNDGKKKNNVSEEKIYKNKKVSELQEKITSLRNQVKNATLDEIYIPNKLKHLKKWYKSNKVFRSFSCNIDDSDIKTIMLLPIQNAWKILLVMGIGVFTNHDNIEYREIIKRLSTEQKLFLIIADSDYIYGTNYQFCHGILGKDLILSQEKLIQALGRIGRNSIQQDYSVRFRSEEFGKLLFRLIPSEEKIEVINMNNLFV